MLKRWREQRRFDRDMDSAVSEVSEKVSAAGQAIENEIADARELFETYPLTPARCYRAEHGVMNLARSFDARERRLVPVWRCSRCAWSKRLTDAQIVYFQRYRP